MNLYKVISYKQKKDLIEADIAIEYREYTTEEIKNIQNTVTNHIFSKSKKDIGEQLNKFCDILNIIEKEKNTNEINI